jgi:lysosomal alpha-mannosidase
MNEFVNRFLEDTFGSCGRPKIGWQIDPFGHAREQAAIFAQMGMDGLFFGRLDYRDKSTRREKLEMEMIWRANTNLGTKSDLFTGVMFNGYSPPPGFCFDIMCDDVVIDNPRSPDYNLDRKVSELIEWAEKEAQSYKSNHIMITMGNDFNYLDAHVWYKNLDKVIK